MLIDCIKLARVNIDGVASLERATVVVNTDNVEYFEASTIFDPMSDAHVESTKVVFLSQSVIFLEGRVKRKTEPPFGVSA